MGSDKSGHRGHLGRPGHLGGSLPKGAILEIDLRKEPEVTLEIDLREGGPGSGNWGHAGVKGQLGGSAPGGGIGGGQSGVPRAAMSIRSGASAKRRHDAAQAAARAALDAGGSRAEASAAAKAAGALTPEDKKAMGISGVNSGADAKARYEEQRAAALDNMVAVENGIYADASRASGKPASAIKLDDDYLAGRVKDRLVKGIASESGLPYNTVNDMVRNWAGSSNDTREECIAMQETASRIFNTPLTEWQQGRRVEIGARRAERITELRDKYHFDEKTIKTAMDADINFRQRFSEGEREKFLSAMYNRTQSDLQSKGIKPDDMVTLYRGMAMTGDQADRAGKGVSLLRDNAMISASTSVNTATSFGEAAPYEAPEGYKPVLATMQVQARDIVGTCTTGLGCLNEHEVVILGRGALAEIKILEAYR